MERILRGEGGYHECDIQGSYIEKLGFRQNCDG